MNDSGNYTCGHEVEKMSKSKYNVQTPDDLIDKFGADTLRMYEMFLGPLEQFKPWDTKGINGVHNFLRKLLRLMHDADNKFIVSEEAPNKAELKSIHKAIKKVYEDIERYSFNTVVSTLMICVNELNDLKCNKRVIINDLLILLSPYAPHIAEELWEKLGNKFSVTNEPLPVFDIGYLKEDIITYPVSFNGKMRFKLELDANLDKQAVEAAVMKHEKTVQLLEGKLPKRVIVVLKKIVNVVV